MDLLVEVAVVGVEDLCYVDLVGARLRPVAGATVVRGPYVGELAVGTEQPQGRPGALAARQFGADLDLAVGEVVRPGLDHR
jgi:hypothetical protein